MHARAQSSRPLPSSGLTPFVDALPRLPKLAGADVDLSATNAMHKFHRDLPATPTFGYGGASYLGPVIEARRGVTTRVTFNNLLRDHALKSSVDASCAGVSEEDKTAPRSVLYLHGGVTPPQSSGHPRATILPGGSAEYVFPNQQEAAGLWYYDRSLGIAGLNRYAGLAGMYLVRDEWDTGLADNPLALPAEDYEIPLVLMERSFNADGTLRAGGVAGSRDESGSVGVVN
ncbi:MAG TPA: multicopper oxidase domain-containing protein, partial [Polyangiales bacterium]